MAEATTKRPGRRPGPSRSREAILAAARAQFARQGYEGASVRAIARDADVDPALVVHFFGTKEQLFTTAMAWPVPARVAVSQVVPGSKSRLGERLVRFFLSLWDEPEQREPITGLLRAATTSPHAAKLLRATLRRNLLLPIAKELDIDDAALRMSLCASQLVGLGITRYILELDPIARLPEQAVVDAVAPTLQRYLTGRL